MDESLNVSFFQYVGVMVTWHQEINCRTLDSSQVCQSNTSLTPVCSTFSTVSVKQTGGRFSILGLMCTFGEEKLHSFVKVDSLIICIGNHTVRGKATHQ